MDKCSDYGGRCDEEAADIPHICPYAQEINDDSDTLCRCCPDCEHECCMDI